MILGISTDSCESHKKFTEKNNLSLILLSDPDYAVSESYGVWAPKSFMGRSFLGVSRTTFLINPQGILIHSWPKVKVAGHITEVLNTVKEMQKVK